MTALGSRRTALAPTIGAILIATLAWPARAASTGHSTTLSLSPVSGSRQFFVEDLAGHDLTSLDLGGGGTMPFRVRVVDQSYAAPTEQFTVSATVNNLYLRTGPSSYAFPTMVPSSNVSVGFGGAPLANVGVSLTDRPSFTVSGTVPSCASLQVSDPVALAGIATDPTAAPLCTLLGALGQAVSGVTVPGLPRAVAPALDLLNVPVQLATGSNTGAFTHADFSSGTIGAGDTARAGGAPAATARTLMTGTPGFATGLVTQVTTQVTAAVGALPLTSPTDDPAGAKATLGATINGLQASATPAVAQLGADVALLGDAVKQSAILDHLGGSLVAPVPSDIVDVSGSYVAFPVLTAAPTSAAPGTYDGTMTVTFVQT